MRTRKIENTRLIDVQTLRIQISTLTKRHAFGEYPAFIRLCIGNEIVFMTIIPNTDNSYLLDCRLEGLHEIQTFLILGDSAPNDTTQFFFICPMTNKRVRTLFVFNQKVCTRYQANFRYLSQVRHNCYMTNEELGNLFTIKNKCFRPASRQSDICKEIAATYYDNDKSETAIKRFRSYSAIRTDCRVRVDNLRKALTKCTHAMRVVRNELMESIAKNSDEPKPKVKSGRKKNDPTKAKSLPYLNRRVEALRQKLQLPGVDKEKVSMQLAEAEKQFTEARDAIAPKVRELEAFIFSQAQTPPNTPTDKPN